MSSLSEANRERLYDLISANVRITDDDFDVAELSYDQLDAVFDKMNAAGYTIGKDTDFRNEWWPAKDNGS